MTAHVAVMLELALMISMIDTSFPYLWTKNSSPSSVSTMRLTFTVSLVSFVTLVAAAFFLAVRQ